MEAGATFDMSAFGPCPIVHSVCLSSDGTTLLVGVRGCEVRLPAQDDACMIALVGGAIL